MGEDSISFSQKMKNNVENELKPIPENLSIIERRNRIEA